MSTLSAALAKLIADKKKNTASKRFMGLFLEIAGIHRRNKPLLTDFFGVVMYSIENLIGKRR